MFLFDSLYVVKESRLPRFVRSLLGLMKCLAEFLLRLLVKTSKATPENTDVCKAIGKNSIIQTTLLRE